MYPNLEMREQREKILLRQLSLLNEEKNTLTNYIQQVEKELKALSAIEDIQK